MERIEKIKKQLDFVKEVIKDYKDNGEAVPASVYEKGIALATELAELEGRK